MTKLKHMPLPTFFAIVIGLVASNVRADLAQSLAKVVDGVGTIVERSPGELPVLLIRESHNSRIGQLEMASMLWRAKNDLGLHEVVVEGYVDGEVPDLKWLDRKNLSPAERISVAVSLLRSGQIHAAEFVRILAPDVTLLAGETKATYNEKIAAKDNGASIGAVMFLAQQDLTVRDSVQLNRLLDPQFGRAMLAFLKAKSATAEELFDRIENHPSLEDAVNLNEELTKKIEVLKQQADAEEAKQLQDEIDALKTEGEFLKARAAADSVFADRCQRARLATHTIVALKVGGGHIQGVAAALKAQNIPYAVLSPASYETPEVDSGWYDAASKGQSTWGQAIDAATQSAARQMNRRSTANADVTHVEADLSLICHKVLDAAGAGGGGPPKWPPNGGFNPDDFKAPYCELDSSSVATDGPDLIFRVFAKKDGQRTGEIWVKTSIDKLEGDGGFALEDVERALKRARETGIHDRDALNKQEKAVEDALNEQLKKGQVDVRDLPKIEGIGTGDVHRITSNAVATFGKTKDAVIRVSLHAK